MKIPVYKPTEINNQMDMVNKILDMDEQIKQLERLVSLADDVLTHRHIVAGSGNKSFEARVKNYWKAREKLGDI